MQLFIFEIWFPIFDNDKHKSSFSLFYFILRNTNFLVWMFIDCKSFIGRKTWEEREKLPSRTTEKLKKSLCLSSIRNLVRGQMLKFSFFSFPWCFLLAYQFCSIQITHKIEWWGEDAWLRSLRVPDVHFVTKIEEFQCEPLTNWIIF